MGAEQVVVTGVDAGAGTQAGDAIPDADAMLAGYRTMVMMRLLHDRATNLQRTGRIHSWLGCLGQEAAIVASGMATAPQDWVFPSYREHAVALVRGIPVRKLLDHLFGNAADNVKGRNLPPEYSFREVNFVSISAPVGTQVPQAVGAAVAAKLKGDPVAVMTYFGDGTASTSDVHTALNFAGVYRAPVVFFCQNNGWAISVPTARQSASESIAARAVAYGMPGVQVDGNDFLATYAVTRAAIEKARAGGGPTLIEALTYRVGPHSTSDDPSAYRDDAEVAPWRDRDPIVQFEQVLAARGLWTPEQGEAIRESLNAELLAAAKAAQAEAQPDLDTLFTDIYAAQPWHIREQHLAHRQLREQG